MPELPEVETMRRTLAASAEGRVLKSFVMHDKKLDASTLECAKNTVLQRVEREGKCLVLRFQTCTVLLHPRMSGRVIRVPPLRQHTRFTMHFEGNIDIAFDDPRRLGTLSPGPRDLVLREDNVFWPTPRDGAWLASRFQRARLPVSLSGKKPLKVALLDSDHIAGVGNIGASESCFYAGIAPSRMPASLDAQAWDALYRGLLTWLDSTLAHEASRSEMVLMYTKNAPNPFAVYGRENEPCPRCQTPITRSVMAGRSTFWCASCQT